MTKKNQVLIYHRVDDRMYDLTGLRTGSVRDQLLRAVSLVDALHEDVPEFGHGNPGGERLLVLGGGASGIACAITAAHLGIPVTVIEREKELFSRISVAKHRRICPYEFDWPRSLPNPPRFPSSIPDFPLSFESMTASEVVDAWQSAVERMLYDFRPIANQPAYIEILHNSDIRDYDIRVKRDKTKLALYVEAEGDWSASGATSTREFGAVICCSGFMYETTVFLQHGTSTIKPPTALRSFFGPRFWIDDDLLSLEHFAVADEPPGSGHRPNRIRAILISGGGDGAMQDFQRAATGDFGVKLLERVQKCIFGLKMESLRLEIALAEDRARRACTWKMSNSRASEPTSELMIWDDVFKKLATELLTNHIAEYIARNGLVASPAAEHQAMVVLGDKLLRAELPIRMQPKIVWVVREASFGVAYALNRFLSFLVSEIHARLYRRVIVRWETRVTEIVPADPSQHTCRHPRGCHGIPHLVQLNGTGDGDTYQIIILRHGLKFPKKPFLKNRPLVPEQMVPYEIPR